MRGGYAVISARSTVSPKTGMRKFPHQAQVRALGFAGQRRVRSDEDGC